MTDMPMTYHKGFALTYIEHVDKWEAPNLDMLADTLQELRAKIDALTAIGSPGLPAIYISRGLSEHEVKFVTASRSADQRKHTTKVIVSDGDGNVWPVECRRLIPDTPENRKEISAIQKLMAERDKQTQEINRRQAKLGDQDRDLMFSLSPQKRANQDAAKTQR